MTEVTFTNAKPCKKPCRECPFKKTSAQGWLGSASTADDPGSAFLDPHWIGEMPLPCHMQVRWTSDDAQEQAKVKPLCFGFLTMMRNAGKLPRNPEFASHVQVMEKDNTFFTFPHEFKQHHNGDHNG